MARLWLLAPLLLASAVSGCAATRRVEAPDALARFAASGRSAAQTAPPAQREPAIEVVLATSPDLVGVVREVPEDELPAGARRQGAHRGELVPLGPTRSPDEALQALRDGASDVVAGVHVRAVDEPLGTLLRYHLARHFERVSVRQAAGPVRARGDEVVVHLQVECYEEPWPTNVQAARVTLVARRGGQDLLRVHGSGDAWVFRDHGAWAATTAAASRLTGPLSPLTRWISQRTLRELRSEALGDALLDALDEATGELARRLAQPLHATP